VEIYILRDNEIKGRNPPKWLLASWLFLFTAIIIRYKNNLIANISEVYKVLKYIYDMFLSLNLSKTENASIYIFMRYMKHQT